MTRAAVLLACTVAACGSSDTGGARIAARVCDALADRLDLRIRAHDADRPLLRSWAGDPDPRARTKYELTSTVNDLVETHATVLAVGPYCSTAQSVPACSTPTVSSVFADVDGVLRRTRVLLEGMRGQGPCAQPDGTVRRRADCSAVAMYLKVSDGAVDLVRAGWSSPVDPSGHASTAATFAARELARWRALVDYGVALAPVCAPRQASSCERLRDGLPDARPDDLAARMGALRAALHDGTPCPPPASDGPATRPPAPDPADQP